MNENAKVKKIAHFSQSAGGGKTFQCGRNVYDAKGICPTMTATMGVGGECVPYIIDLIKL